MKRFALVLLILIGQCLPNALADSIRTALVNLCDPAKIATISSERGANPRVRKIAYWLEMARRDGREPSTEMAEVLIAAIKLDLKWKIQALDDPDLEPMWDSWSSRNSLKKNF